MRLHRGGRFRSWLARRLGGSPEEGERALRRLLHLSGALALLYEPLPDRLGPIPKSWALLIALGVVLGLEAGRRLGRLELPTIRPAEADRGIASFAFYAIGLTITLLLFPAAVASAAILVAAFADPLMGELRALGRRPHGRDLPVALAAALALASVGLLAVGRWSVPGALLGGLVVAATALAVEGPRWHWFDDDLAMPIAGALALTLLLLLLPGLPGLSV